ncbi:MAG TPA: ABC transporter transmembrane domain-containing protein, partial [Acidimicrobiales bacterium]|nr:ABC transporter transmembrane domain-containing protein [Acidimicrobiales bacterium]
MSRRGPGRPGGNVAGGEGGGAGGGPGAPGGAGGVSGGPDPRLGERATPARRAPAVTGFGPARFMGGGGGDKSLDFTTSGRRLLRELAPQRAVIALAMLFGITAVGLSVLGPRLLGDATNFIFSGVIGKSVPPGVSKAELLTRLRHEGKGTLADLLGSVHFVPGQGIDFDHIGQILLTVLLIYLGSSLASLFQGRLTTVAVQRSVKAMREKVQDKLTRLPLSYFDGQPR